MARKTNKPKIDLFTLPIVSNIRTDTGGLSAAFIETMRAQGEILAGEISIKEVGTKLDFEIWDQAAGQGYLIEYKNNLITVFKYQNNSGGGRVGRSSPLRRTSKVEKRFLRHVERQIKPLQLGRKKQREVKIEALESFQDITDVAISAYLPGVVIQSARETLQPEMMRLVEHKMSADGGRTQLLPYTPSGGSGPNC